MAISEIANFFREIGLFDFTSFFGLDFFKIFWPTVQLNIKYYHNCNFTKKIITFIFLFFQEYHTQIDDLKKELEAARNKDGVFLPKEKYEEQLKAKEVADNIVREKTLQLKALEEDLEKFNVST